MEVISNSNLAFIGTQELIILLIVVIVLFGATKLPQLGSGIGEAIKNFKKSMKDDAIDVTPKSSESEKLDREKKDQA